MTHPDSRRGAHRPRRIADMGLGLVATFLVLLLVAGVGMLAYPTVADVWNRMHQSQVVASYVETIDDLGAQRRQELLDAARSYNAQLERSAQDDQMDRWSEASTKSEEFEQAYRSTLDVTGTGIMGYVTIPRLKTRLPIYHGTEDSVLQIAVGHLPGSSLPVGGEGTHAVVSGHTGLPSARLLTGLDELRAGDTFAFHVLDETYTYEVDQVEVVLPDDFQYLSIDPGGDYATLITCTPYGINTHRLLVRGHRIPNPTTPDTTDYDWPQRLFRSAIAGCATLTAGGTAVAIRRRLRAAASPAGRHIAAPTAA